VKKESGGSMVVIVAIALFVPLLYILSLGPCIWLFTRGYLSVPVANVVQVILLAVRGSLRCRAVYQRAHRQILRTVGSAASYCTRVSSSEIWPDAGSSASILNGGDCRPVASGLRGEG
jgi:hypothetical protein